MAAIIMDGTALARRTLEDVRRRATEFHDERGRPACLATVLVGDDPASRTYVQMKANRCRANGVESRHHGVPASAGTDDVRRLVRALSADPTVDGILVQHPLPAHIDERAVFDAIAPDKDVDGVTTASFGSMAFGSAGFASCTPAGILALLDAYEVPLAGRHAVVVGRSPILGKPVALLLLGRNATVTIAHSHTRELPALVAEADIVVAAVGRPRLIQGDWIKPGSAVIDAGYIPGNVGDVDYEPAERRAGWITPVPGGVGPMTVAVLLAQTLDAAFAHG